MRSHGWVKILYSLLNQGNLTLEIPAHLSRFKLRMLILFYSQLYGNIIILDLLLAIIGLIEIGMNN